MKSSDKFRSFVKNNWQTITIIILLTVLLMQIFQLIMSSMGEPDSLEAFSKVTDWGLSFQGKEGDPPIANISSEELKKYSAYYIGDTEEKYIYLTFDAGYENGYTSRVLEILKQNDVKASFFLVGDYLKTQPDLVRKMAEEGHIVANHTATHPDMSTISQMADFRVELEEVERLYFDITGNEMLKLYRPPRGKFSISNLEQAQLLGYKTIFWSLAYADWDNSAQPNPQASLNKLNSRIHNGAIVLLHLNSQTNAEILDELIKGWKSSGYEFKQLTDMIE